MTMTSYEERRRAVAELRGAETGAYRHVDALDVIAGSVGVDADGKLSREIEKETYAALADLIDLPTCQMVECAIDHGSRSWGMRCTACGKEFEHMKPGFGWRFCPSCGAEVTEKEENDG